MSGRVDSDRTSVKALLEIDVDKPLLPGSYVEFDKRRVFVLFGHEHNPRACARCNGGGFGFKFAICPSDFIEMHENAVMCGYEDGRVSFAPLLVMEEVVGQLADRLPRSEMTAMALTAAEHEADKEEYLREEEKVDDGLMDESAWPIQRARLDFSVPYWGSVYNRYQPAVQRRQAVTAVEEEEEEEMSAVQDADAW